MQRDGYHHPRIIGHAAIASFHEGSGSARHHAFRLNGTTVEGDRAASISAIRFSMSEASRIVRWFIKIVDSREANCGSMRRSSA
jgi:hypothetical protein